jgi:hypothetical protein
MIAHIVCRKNMYQNSIDMVFLTVYTRPYHSPNKIKSLGKFIFKKNTEKGLGDDRGAWCFKIRINEGLTIQSN